MVDLLIAALGAIVTVTGAAWWVKERQSASRRLYRALLNPDPAGRAREVRSLAGRPLAQFARSLLEAARRETEPSVLTAIGELVASHSWEPADGIDVAELRKTIYERLSAKEGRSRSRLEGTGSAERSPRAPTTPRPEATTSPAAGLRNLATAILSSTQFALASQTVVNVEVFCDGTVVKVAPSRAQTFETGEDRHPGTAPPGATPSYSSG
jgi:hypothetical protein